MQLALYEEIVKILEKKRIKLEPGLTMDEISKIEQFYQIKFPKVLEEFYQIAMPISHDFINWRDFNEENIEQIKEALSWPLEGMLLDVEEGYFWMKKWGHRPESNAKAKEICCENMKNAPMLIPVYGHRYMPYVEGTENPPVLSVYQTDIIYYGSNLKEYIELEVGVISDDDIDYESIQTVPVWTDIMMAPFENIEEE